MTSTPIRIVLVDDAPDLRVLMRNWFELDGEFDIVGEAADGQEGIEVVAREQPDVVLLDAMMPGTDGVTAIPHILQASPQTRIVLFSAAASEYEASAMEAGAHLCLDKRLDLDVVTAQIKALCVERRASA